MILETFTLLCLALAFVLLIVLSVIDLKIGLLPNIYNAGLAACGIIFHSLTAFSWLSFEGMVLGAIIGGGLLYGIRLAGNKIYKQDTLGLGDVKLVAAGGVWLGSQGILLAIAIGAFAGIIHSLCVLYYKKMQEQDTGKLSHFSIPAGPGFCVGIFTASIYQFLPFLKHIL